MFNIGFSELLLVLLVWNIHSGSLQMSGRRICPRLPAGWGAR